MRKFKDLLARLQRLFRKNADPPHDPYAYRFAPVPRRPKGRSGAVALEEPDEPR